jgi:hypothetical protein
LEKEDLVLSAFANAFRTPDLRRKLLFVVLIIGVFRLGSQVPTPGVDVGNVQSCIDAASQGDNAGLYSLVNLFSGGALLQLTVFALGIMPYITASIILQLLVVVIPRLEALKKEARPARPRSPSTPATSRWAWPSSRRPASSRWRGPATCCRAATRRSSRCCTTTAPRRSWSWSSR